MTEREFILTSSPSMDILISSNLERLIYRITSEDAAQTKVFMDALSSNGRIYDYQGNDGEIILLCW